MRSTAGSAWAPGSRRTTPLTVTRPAARSASAPRRELSPAWARILLRRIGGRSALRDAHDGITVDVSGRLGDRELALDLGQVGEVAQAEGDEEVARGLVEEGPAWRVLATGDADHPAVEEIVEHRVRVHPAHGVDVGTRHRLTIGDDGEGLESGAGEARARPAPRQLHEPRRHLRPRDETIAAAHLDDLERAAARVEAGHELAHELAGLPHRVQPQHFL